MSKEKLEKAAGRREGKSSLILPDHMLTKIADPKERRRYGRTTSERMLKAGLELEREEHNKFLGYLDRNEFAYCHSRTDRRTTANLGVPDFIIGCRVGLAIEFKRLGGELSAKQETWRARHEARGGIYKILECYEKAVEVVEAFSDDPKAK